MNAKELAIGVATVLIAFVIYDKYVNQNLVYKIGDF